MKSVTQQVREVFQKFNIPEFIWRPIMLLESGGNPNSEAITEKEHSIGLFQINVKSNTQFAGINLKDPTKNAEIAAKYFIKPAYEQAKSMKGLSHADMTEYVWKNGIRPDWNSVVATGKNTKLRLLADSPFVSDTEQTVVGSVFAGDPETIASGGLPETSYNPQKTAEYISDALTPEFSGVTKIVVYILIFLAVGFALFMVFRPEGLTAENIAGLAAKI